MFTQLKNIDSAFRYVKWFTIAIIMGCLLLSCFICYKSYQLVSNNQQHIYLLANGKVLEAFASDRKDNIPVEARDHIKMFHQYFFTMDPDDKVIQSNTTKALYLADASAKRQYDNLKENGYYSNIIAGNISQEITVDSTVINLNQYPYYFRCYAIEKITRSSSIAIRNLITEGYLRNVSRSDNNPHGFLIERWSTLENKDLKIQTR